MKGGKALPPGPGDTAREWCEPAATVTSVTAGVQASLLVLALSAYRLGGGERSPEKALQGLGSALCLKKKKKNTMQPLKAKLLFMHN